MLPMQVPTAKEGRFRSLRDDLYSEDYQRSGSREDVSKKEWDRAPAAAAVQPSAAAFAAEVAGANGQAGGKADLLLKDTNAVPPAWFDRKLRSDAQRKQPDLSTVRTPSWLRRTPAGSVQSEKASQAVPARVGEGLKGSSQGANVGRPEPDGSSRGKGSGGALWHQARGPLSANTWVGIGDTLAQRQTPVVLSERPPPKGRVGSVHVPARFALQWFPQVLEGPCNIRVVVKVPCQDAAAAEGALAAGELLTTTAAAAVRRTVAQVPVAVGEPWRGQGAVTVAGEGCKAAVAGLVDGEPAPAGVVAGAAAAAASSSTPGVLSIARNGFRKASVSTAGGGVEVQGEDRPGEARVRQGADVSATCQPLAGGESVGGAVDTAGSQVEPATWLDMWLGSAASDGSGRSTGGRKGASTPVGRLVAGEHVCHSAARRHPANAVTPAAGTAQTPVVGIAGSTTEDIRTFAIRAERAAMASAAATAAAAAARPLPGAIAGASAKPGTAGLPPVTWLGLRAAPKLRVLAACTAAEGCLAGPADSTWDQEPDAAAGGTAMKEIWGFKATLSGSTSNSSFYLTDVRGQLDAFLGWRLLRVEKVS